MIQLPEFIKIPAKGLANSYSQLFLSNNQLAGILIALASFVDPIAGICGLAMAFITNVMAWLFHLPNWKIENGSLAFNSLLTGLFLGHSYNLSEYLALILLAGSFLSLILTVNTEAILAKHNLPYLSVPFLLSVWLLKLSTDNISNLDPNSTQIFVFNHVLRISGEGGLFTYQFLENLPLPIWVSSYLKSLGAVLFQYSTLSGLVIALALIIHSRIAFSLSLIGFITGYAFYQMMGADMNDLTFGFIGFNFILTALALGGFFLIPSASSYFLVIVLTPAIALIGIASESVLAKFGLPLLSLPFNAGVILFLYFLYFRTKSKHLLLTPVQLVSPEKNLYRYLNQKGRFGNEQAIKLSLPIVGTWRISQGHAGKITHLDDWQYAWDFDLTDDENRTYRLPGFSPEDYFCYGLPVVAPALGQVVKVVDGIHDNEINKVNLGQNWGNTIVIQHSPTLFSKLSHLKSGSIRVAEGEWVAKGQTLALVGNSGRSPEPHLHFQLQATPYIGSKTLNIPLSNFMVKVDKGFQFVTQGIPEENALVCNPISNQTLAEALNFLPGKKLVWNKNGAKSKGLEVWEVFTDAYNQTYFHDAKNNATLYFQNKNGLFESRTFYGNKNTLLFQFHLCSQQILQSWYPDLELKNEVEISSLFNPTELFLQDWVAPFFRFLKTEYRINYAFNDNDITQSKIILKGELRSTRLGIFHSSSQFELEFFNKQLVAFRFESKREKLEATCSENA